jgi:hypothetical protein
MRRAESAGLRSFEPVSDVMILVALDRAERHERPNPRNETGVHWTRLLAHLGFVHNSWTTRKLRPQVEALIDAGLVRKTRNAGRVRWGLTDVGAMRATQARLDGEAALPDSPQRREWQRGRAEAERQIDRIRERLARALHGALAILDGGKADSDDWFDLADRLRRECRRLGGATFCLHEWDEPDDEQPDLDVESRSNWEVRRGLSALFQQDPKEVCKMSADESIATAEKDADRTVLE